MYRGVSAGHTKVVLVLLARQRQAKGTSCMQFTRTHAPTKRPNTSSRHFKKRLLPWRPQNY